MDGYGKINKAVMVCSTIQAMRPTHLKPDSKTVDHHVVPVSYDYSTQQPKSNTQFTQNKAQIMANLATNKQHQALPQHVLSPVRRANADPKTKRGKKVEVDIEDSFTNYINRVRIGMRTKSMVGDAPSCDNLSYCEDDEIMEDSGGKDEFSEYLDRARIKIRTTSSIPAGRF